MAEAQAAASGTPRRWWARIGFASYALFMSYIHSIYITKFYVTEEEYWWTGMTLVDRLANLGLGFAANVGLLLMPFLRTPGWTIKVILMLLLIFGALLSGTWLIGNFSKLGVDPYWLNHEPIYLYLFDLFLFWLPRFIHGYALYQYISWFIKFIISR